MSSNNTTDTFATETSINFAPVIYPSKDTVYWNTKIDPKDKLKIVNPADFPKYEILRSLGLQGHELSESFGITDKQEIINRSKLLKLLYDNKKLSDWLYQYSNVELENGRLPEYEGQKFLNYYSAPGGNAYWNTIQKILDLVGSPADMPETLSTFVQFLKDSQALAATENEMAKVIGDLIQVSAAIEGSATTTVNTGTLGHRTADFIIYGHQRYSYQVSQANNYYLPDWLDSNLNPLKWCGVSQWIERSTKKRIRKNAYKSMVITEADDNIVQDLNSAAVKIAKKLIKLTAKHSFPKKDLPTDRKLMFDTLKELSDEFKCSDYNSDIDSDFVYWPDWDILPEEIHLEIGFGYDQDGLKIKVARIKGTFPDGKTVRNSDIEAVNLMFNGFSVEAAEVIQKNRYRLDKKVLEQRNDIISVKFAETIADLDPKFFDLQHYSSYNMDMVYKWANLNNLFNEARFNPIYNELIKHRKFVRRNLEDIKVVNEIARIYREKAATQNLPLCLPQFSDKNEISFKGLVPMHLVINDFDDKEKKQVLVPINNFPSINGQIVCLTGANGGGKTVAGNSAMESVYIAQSGLLLYADQYTANVKTVIGSVTNEKNEKGSLATVVLKKYTNIFEELENTAKDKVLVFIDEIGKGTQELEGIQVGKDVLKELSRRGYSVVFSTQMTELAEYVKSNLGALCIKVDRNHKFSEGIGTGQLIELSKTVGLDKYIKH
ncbi:MAG: hypothetical protein WCO55_00460 [Candidatus Falkowbacteria bacterium]